MELRTRVCGLLVLASVCPPAEAMLLYEPQLCYLLDGFLGLYGLIITGMFIREKFFKGKVKSAEESIYSDLRNQDNDSYAPLRKQDPEAGRNRRGNNDDTYTGLTKRAETDEYKVLPMKRERQRKGEQVYQGLSTATKDTPYDSLQMKPLPPR